jgi:hypothetical protein
VLQVTKCKRNGQGAPVLQAHADDADPQNKIALLDWIQSITDRPLLINRPSGSYQELTMKLNQSLTAAVTAAALVAGAGFAYAQTAAPQVTNTPDASSAQGPVQQNQGTTGATGSMNSDSTMQAQPSTSSSTTSMDNSATPSVDTTLEPRADRN